MHRAVHIDCRWEAPQTWAWAGASGRACSEPPIDPSRPPYVDGVLLWASTSIPAPPPPPPVLYLTTAPPHHGCSGRRPTPPPPPPRPPVPAASLVEPTTTRSRLIALPCPARGLCAAQPSSSAPRPRHRLVSLCSFVVQQRAHHLVCLHECPPKSPKTPSAPLHPTVNTSLPEPSPCYDLSSTCPWLTANPCRFPFLATTCLLAP